MIGSLGKYLVRLQFSSRGQANLCAFEDIVAKTRRFVPANSAVVEPAGLGVVDVGIVKMLLLVYVYCLVVGKGK